MRVVLAEDLTLLRDGLVRLLQAHDIDVVGAAGDPDTLMATLEHCDADLAILDVRMPPTFTNEGLVAAIEARRRWPDLGVMVLSQYVEQIYARELLRDDRGGIGYLLKDRVADVTGFAAAVRQVANGGTVLDPQVVSTLLGAQPKRTPLSQLTPREQQVLRHMAEGRSNAAIAASLVVTEKAINKHINSIFMKLDLPLDADDNRRVLAVLTYLQSHRQHMP